MHKYLAEKIKESAVYSELEKYIAHKKTPIALTGVGAVQKAFICHALHTNLKGKIIFITSDEQEALKAVSDLKSFLGQKVLYFPPKDIEFISSESRSREWEYERLSVVSKVAEGEYEAVVTTPEALIQYTVDKKRLKTNKISIKLGKEFPLNDLISDLVRAGYSRTDMVEGKGQFAVRGGIIDIYPVNATYPIRIEFWGDEVDSMGYFDIVTQRRTENIKSFKISVASEILIDETERASLLSKIEGLIQKYSKKASMADAAERLKSDYEKIETNTHAGLDKYINLIYDSPPTFFDFLDENSIIAISDETKIIEKLKNYYFLQNEDIKSYLEKGFIVSENSKHTLSKEELYKNLSAFDILYLDTLPHSFYELPLKGILGLISKQLPNLSMNFEFIKDDIEAYRKQGYEILIMAASQKRGENLRDLLSAEGIAATFVKNIEALSKNTVYITEGRINGGMEFSDIRLAVLCDGDKPDKKKKKTSSKKSSEKIKSYSDLKPGDYVVHANHGIGQYLGIEKLTTLGCVKDYVKIKYSGNDILYVPANQLDLISKYLSYENTDGEIKLAKMGGSQWQRAKSRVKKAVDDLAETLIKLYAERQSLKGYAFSPDHEWQRDFESRFEFEETEDQLRCVAEIKQDMESSVPMDRLLCGDVGFGKTEVALRAAFKCVTEGKQVAIMVPTTILAWQHYQTVIKRFQGYPVTYDILSRFRTKKQQEEIIRKLRKGEIDIVVGTHRIIQKDVEFKDLGLVIIDEEQRFGVAHKERLKELTKNVDVLTLTATPIPRTLNMALSGIRDISLIEEPPRDRHPVSTYVIEYDFNVIMEAIRKELRRGGQVFYLHNRIDTIERTASRIAMNLPDRKVAFAHGQMEEDELSEIWSGVVNGEINVLVCTTIIETGVDVPNANTLIIEDADRLGLSQLYQLRGRVGRSHRRASCYLTYRKGKILSEDAAKRLSAIREFTEFGSGFKIALRDLEIRGAGNILGAEQHGHLNTVGYDLYMKLLNEAVKLKKGDIIKEKTECVFDIAISAHIPEDYIESSEVRIDIYKKIAAMENNDDYSDLIDELTDRFGDVPQPVINLCEIALLRNMASVLDIAEITEKAGRAVITADNMSFEDVAKLAEIFKGRLLYNAGEKPYITLLPKKNENMVDVIRRFLEEYYRLSKKEG